VTDSLYLVGGKEMTSTMATFRPSRPSRPRTCGALFQMPRGHQMSTTVTQLLKKHTSSSFTSSSSST